MQQVLLKTKLSRFTGGREEDPTRSESREAKMNWNRLFWKKAGYNYQNNTKTTKSRNWQKWLGTGMNWGNHKQVVTAIWGKQRIWQIMWNFKETKYCGESDRWVSAAEDKWTEVRGVELMAARRELRKKVRKWQNWDQTEKKHKTHRSWHKHTLHNKPPLQLPQKPPPKKLLKTI